MFYSKTKYLPLLLFMVTVACGNKMKKEEAAIIKEPAVQTIIADKVSYERFIPLALFSLLQANRQGVLLTPHKPINSHVLLFQDRTSTLPCCTKLKGLIGEGRGPGELLQISASSETFNSDTLLFYSAKDGRMMVFDQELENAKLPEISSSNLLLNPGFSYSNGHLLVPIDININESGYLFRLYNYKNQNSTGAFPLRVPKGYEPAIRNVISSSASLPDGFAISFLGDRKIFFLNYDGEIVDHLILGKSDPIGKPYKITNPIMSPSAMPYIPKMEYQHGKLFVLMESQIWIIDYATSQADTILNILDDPDAERSKVMDFSVTDDLLYLRMAPHDLYKVPVRSAWLN